MISRQVVQRPFLRKPTQFLVHLQPSQKGPFLRRTGDPSRRHMSPLKGDRLGRRNVGGVINRVQRWAMIVVRMVFRAQFGRGGAYAARFAEHNPQIMAELDRTLGVVHPWRLLTDLPGDFGTLFIEVGGASPPAWGEGGGAGTMPTVLPGPG